MRIDARAPGYVGPWSVIHIPSCRDISRDTVMADDVTCCYEAKHPDWMALAPALGHVPTVIKRANKIRIMPARRLILIDPVDDPEETETDEEQMQPGTPEFEAWVNEDVKENT